MLMQLAPSAGVLAFVLILYFWKIRPALHEQPKFFGFYEELDGFWAKVWKQIKRAWDIVAAAVLVVLPEVPGILTDLGAIDLTGLVPEATAKIIAKVVALALILVRVLYLRAPKSQS